MNENWAEYTTFWGNARYAVSEWHSCKTTNWAFQGNALRNKSPVDHFLVRQHFLAIPGVWSGQRAQKWQFWKTHFWRLSQTAISSQRVRQDESRTNAKVSSGSARTNPRRMPKSAVGQPGQIQDECQSQQRVSQDKSRTNAKVSSGSARTNMFCSKSKCLINKIKSNEGFNPNFKSFHCFNNTLYQKVPLQKKITFIFHISPWWHRYLFWAWAIPVSVKGIFLLFLLKLVETGICYSSK